MTIEALLQRQRRHFESGITRPLEFRKCELMRLRAAIVKNKRKIEEALWQDLGKAGAESYMTEIGIVLDEIRMVCRNLKSWMACQKAPLSLAQFPAKNRVLAEPYGVVLIMAPWNYPFQLCLMPLVGALAAGNCCVIKPSAYAPAVSNLLATLLGDCFPEEYVAVVQGGREENQTLLEQRFDYIFFTGGTEVGKVVLEKAARYVTPVTLELGGKSPCIVDRTADVKRAAKRIVFGKFLNCGQTCVAPDYVLVQEDRMGELLDWMERYIRNFFGKRPLDMGEYPRIVNEKHYNRLRGLMREGKIAIGGQCRRSTLQIAPTVITHVNGNSPIMREEIFGPLLPVIPYRSLGSAIRFVRRREKPLALYLFTESDSVKRRVLSQISFGGGCINDTILHLATSHMGFGGVGMSGMGAYHGKKSFDTFTHYKGVMEKSRHLDLPLRYHPYTAWKRWMLQLFLR